MGGEIDTILRLVWDRDLTAGQTVDHFDLTWPAACATSSKATTGMSVTWNNGATQDSS